MSNESLKALIVITGKPVNGESSEACTNASEMISVYVRFLCNIVNSREIVLHTLSCIISAYLLQPLHSKARETSSVRSNDYVTVGCHYLEVPSVTPELAYRRLRTALAEEKRRILLIRIKMRRIDNPTEHLFAVSCLCPALLNLTGCKFIQNMFVLK